MPEKPLQSGTPREQAAIARLLEAARTSDQRELQKAIQALRREGYTAEELEAPITKITLRLRGEL